MIRRRTVSCRQVGRALQAYLDGELADDGLAQRLGEHLDACRDCGLEAETYRSLKAALQRHAGLPESPELIRLREFGQRLAAGEN